MKLCRYADVNLYVQEFYDGAFSFEGKIDGTAIIIYVVFTPTSLAVNLREPITIRELNQIDHQLLWVTVKNHARTEYDDEVVSTDLVPRLRLVG